MSTEPTETQETEHIPLFSRPVGDRTAGDKALAWIGGQGALGALIAWSVRRWRGPGKEKPPRDALRGG